MSLKKNKKGSVVDQPWTEVLQMTVLVVFLIIFIPAVARWCSQSQTAHKQNVDYETFDSIAEYISNFHEGQASSIPLTISQNENIIRIYSRCTKPDQVRGKDCASEPKICLQSTSTQKIAPYCHQIRGNEGEIVDFLETGDIKTVTQGFSIVKKLDERKVEGRKENSNIRRTVITFTVLG